MDAISIILFTFVCIWFICTVFQSCVTVYHWFRTDCLTPKESGKRWSVMLYVLMSTFTGAACLILKFMDIYIHFYIALICYSNLISLYLLPQIFTITTEKMEEYDRKIARIRCLFLIFGVVNLICVAASISDHEYLGGSCSKDMAIPYLMDIMLLL